MIDNNKDMIVPINLDEKQAALLFATDDEFEALFNKIKKQAEAHEPDVTTSKGRDEIKSLAYKITRTKTALDEMGRRVKEEAQKTVTQVDATRKKMRDMLDELKVSVREPLTLFEAEQAEKDQAVNQSLNRLAELKNVRFNATPEDIAQMQSEVQDIATRNDWRGKEEKAADLIDVCRKIHAQAFSAAQERKRMEEENARLQAERQQAEAQERERAAQQQAEEQERQRQEQTRKDADEAQKAEIERLKREKKEADQRVRDAEEAAQRQKEQFEKERIEKERAEAERVHQEELAQKRRKAEEEEAQKLEAERQAKESAEFQNRREETIKDMMNFFNIDESHAEGCADIVIRGDIRHIKFH